MNPPPPPPHAVHHVYDPIAVRTAWRPLLPLPPPSQPSAAADPFDACMSAMLSSRPVPFVHGAHPEHASRVTVTGMTRATLAELADRIMHCTGVASLPDVPARPVAVDPANFSHTLAYYFPDYASLMEHLRNEAYARKKIKQAAQREVKLAAARADLERARALFHPLALLAGVRGPPPVAAVLAALNGTPDPVPETTAFPPLANPSPPPPTPRANATWSAIASSHLPHKKPASTAAAPRAPTAPTRSSRLYAPRRARQSSSHAPAAAPAQTDAWPSLTPTRTSTSVSARPTPKPPSLPTPPHHTPPPAPAVSRAAAEHDAAIHAAGLASDLDVSGAALRIVALDIEAYEFNHRVLTEFGYTVADLFPSPPHYPETTDPCTTYLPVTLAGDTRDEDGMPRDWALRLTSRHLLVREHLGYRNGVRVADAKDDFHARSAVLSLSDSLAHVVRVLGTATALVGHAIASDLAFLRGAGAGRAVATHAPAAAATCVIDTQVMFKAVTATLDTLRLAKILDALAVPYVPPILHNAGNDAWYTMLAFLKMAGVGVDAAPALRLPRRDEDTAAEGVVVMDIDLVETVDDDELDYY
ncbi:hypothetical protein H9P43_007430 [Blastocladiella emersonii ATCC 22665]|nr:hypothetical protein H9P43_007430 [Blastocladiella emersonii ATCC 22665]